MFAKALIYKGIDRNLAAKQGLPRRIPCISPDKQRPAHLRYSVAEFQSLKMLQARRDQGYDWKCLPETLRGHDRRRPRTTARLAGRFSVYAYPVIGLGLIVADKKEKTVSYRRAQWINDAAALDLEKCLRDALKKLPTVAQRSIVQGDQYARIAQTSDGPGEGLLLHVTTETPGEAASLVPKVAAGSSGLNLKTQNPPADGEWLDGDAFLYVCGDHVCVCTTAIHDSAIKTFIWDFFTKAKLPTAAIQFDLVKVADISKVKMLRSQGVKELEIRGTLYQATTDFERRKAHAASVVGAAAKHIRAIFGKPHDVTPDALKVILTIRTDERRLGGIVLGEKKIEDLAADAVKNYEKGDDYVIITKTGQRISPEEIFVRTKVSIDRDGKTVQRDKAWKELSKFFNDLKSIGVLEQ